MGAGGKGKGRRGKGSKSPKGGVRDGRVREWGGGYEAREGEGRGMSGKGREGVEGEWVGERSEGRDWVMRRGEGRVGVDEVGVEVGVTTPTSAKANPTQAKQAL